jgi:hypothetical protein
MGRPKRVDEPTVVPPPSNTEVPPACPTIVPAFDVGQVARNAEVVLSEDGVYEVVPDVQWSGESLDLVERMVLKMIDGVAPLWLLENLLGMRRDELHSTVCVLQARGFIRSSPGPTESGTFPIMTFEDL